MNRFNITSSRVAAMADATAQFVTKCARAGRIEFVQLSNGVRLYDDSAASAVRQLKAEGLANRGRQRAA